MAKEIKKIIAEKTDLHARNKHRGRYDFPVLVKACPELKKFVAVNKFGDESIDFTNQSAVKILNKALLKHFYGINDWDIPEHYLCPPIPGRADYIHYIADLLASCNNETIPTGNKITGLDIGVGANCIYPLIGAKEYAWNFVGTDIDPVAVDSAKKIVLSNRPLDQHIDIRLQPMPMAILNGIIKPGEKFDFTICNPPFHSSRNEALASNKLKWKKLGVKKDRNELQNFGGQSNELWCRGGEVGFVTNMIEQSIKHQNSIFWFSSLISKSEHLPEIYTALRIAGATEVKTINMAQGQKISRIVAWTFLSPEEQLAWREERWT